MHRKTMIVSLIVTLLVTLLVTLIVAVIVERKIGLYKVGISKPCGKSLSCMKIVLFLFVLILSPTYFSIRIWPTSKWSERY